MSKLFKLKKWLTIPDTAKHLSIIVGEPVTAADVLRLALDGQLTISVYLVNGACARPLSAVKLDEIEYEMVPNPIDQNVLMKRLKGGPVISFEGMDGFFQICNHVIDLDNDVWRLPMVGAERLDVENAYQRETNGPIVTLENIEGAFVMSGNGSLHQLQESYEDNAFQAGSLAQLRELNRYIEESRISDDKAAVMREVHAKDRAEFKERNKTIPRTEKYYPAGGLPNDGVLVVEKVALVEFEKKLTEEDCAIKNNSYINDSAEILSVGVSIPRALKLVLEVMNRNWLNYDPERIPKQVNIAREIDAKLGLGKKGDPNSDPSRDAKTIAKLIKPDSVDDAE